MTKEQKTIPTIRQRAQTASSVLQVGRTSLPSLLANANGNPVLLGGTGGSSSSRGGSGGSGGMHSGGSGRSGNGGSGSATTSQAPPLMQHQRQRPSTVSDYRRKRNRCPGKYCSAASSPKSRKSQKSPTKGKEKDNNSVQTNNNMCALLYKSIIEDKYAGVVLSSNIMTRDRAKMYTTVSVCQNCYATYTSKDRERETMKQKSNERATKMLRLAASKYAKYTGNDGTKIKPGTSRVERLYEKSKEKVKLPPSILAALNRETLSAKEREKLVEEYFYAVAADAGGARVHVDAEQEQEQEPEVATEVQEFEQEYSATAAMEKITFEQVQPQPEEMAESGNEDNVCLLCEEDVDQCHCNLSPRVDVRALIGRVIPDLFEQSK